MTTKYSWFDSILHCFVLVRYAIKFQTNINWLWMHWYSNVVIHRNII